MINMGTKVTASGGNDFSPTPPGLHRAVCIAYIDLGTQLKLKYGSTTEKVWKPEVVLLFETPDVTLDMDGEQKPYNISKWYTKSLAPKANLRHDLESWRSVGFTEAELKEFDLDNILGKPCQINVVNILKNGETKEKLTSILPLSKGMPKPVATIKPWRYDVFGDFKKFPPEMSDGFKNIVLKCREMSDPTPTSVENDTPSIDPSAGDEIPF
jgi:hypothetical protein